MNIREHNIVHASRDQVTDPTLCLEAATELLFRLADLRGKMYRLYCRNLERDLQRDRILQASERIPKIDKARFELMALLRAKPEDLRIFADDEARMPRFRLSSVRGGDGEIIDPTGVDFSPEISEQIFRRLDRARQFSLKADLLWHRAMEANAMMRLVISSPEPDLDEMTRVQEERNALTVAYFDLLDEYDDLIGAEE